MLISPTKLPSNLMPSSWIMRIRFPHFFQLDHQPSLIQALVITVRGTLSLEDCITDAVAHPESLQETGEFVDSPSRFDEARAEVWI